MNQPAPHAYAGQGKFYYQRVNALVEWMRQSWLSIRLKDSSDVDLVREMIRHIRHMAQRMMDMDVESLCAAAYGERSPERANSRNGYRERTWETRGGSVDLKIPKLPWITWCEAGDIRRPRGNQGCGGEGVEIHLAALPRLFFTKCVGSSRYRLSFDGFRTPVDEYYGAIVRGDAPKLVRQEMPSRLAEIISFLGRSNEPRRAALTSFLLDAAGDFCNTLAAAIEQALRENKELRRVSTRPSDVTLRRDVDDAIHLVACGATARSRGYGPRTRGVGC